MKRVEGRVAIITGAASPNGIGFATAKILVREGGKVVLTDVDAEGVAARAAELVEAGGEAVSMKHDVRSESDWADAIALATGAFGRLDILVNNAGIAYALPIEETTLEQHDTMMAVNVGGVFLGCKAAIAQFRAQKGPGAIVNVSSAAGIIGIPRASIYGASKAAVCIMTKCLAAELGSENIRVNSVHPGTIATDLLLGNAAKDPGSSVDLPMPLSRLGEPIDIAAMILFLASDEAKYITGGQYLVDGGLTAI